MQRFSRCGEIFRVQTASVLKDEGLLFYLYFFDSAQSHCDRILRSQIILWFHFFPTWICPMNMSCLEHPCRCGNIISLWGLLTSPTSFGCSDLDQVCFVAVANVSQLAAFASSRTWHSVVLSVKNTWHWAQRCVWFASLGSWLVLFLLVHATFPLQLISHDKCLTKRLINSIVVQHVQLATRCVSLCQRKDEYVAFFWFFTFCSCLGIFSLFLLVLRLVDLAWLVFFFFFF